MNALSRDQLASRREKAVRFVPDVLEDEDRVREIDAESLDDDAERRKIQTTNPRRRPAMGRSITSVGQLKREIEALREENEQLQSRLDDIIDIAAPDDHERHDDDEDEDE